MSNLAKTHDAVFEHIEAIGALAAELPFAQAEVVLMATGLTILNSVYRLKNTQLERVLMVAEVVNVLRKNDEHEGTLQ